MMIKLEFLWSGIVNHYSNFGKILHPLDYFCVHLATGQIDIYIPPSLPPSLLWQSFCKLLVQFFAVCSLRNVLIQRRVNRKVVPLIP